MKVAALNDLKGKFELGFTLLSGNNARKELWGNAK